MAYSWPCPSTALVTSYYGYRTAPVAGASTFHAAIDIGATEGSEVIAIEGGTVYAISSSSLRGNFVRVLHPDGRVSHYQHLQKAVDGLEVGQTVLQNELIAYSGHTGIGTGPHLDFRLYVNTSSVGVDTASGTINPLSVLTPKIGGVVLPAGAGMGTQKDLLENNTWIDGKKYNPEGELIDDPLYCYTNYYCLPNTLYRLSKAVSTGIIVEFNRGVYVKSYAITDLQFQTTENTTMLGIAIPIADRDGFEMYAVQQDIPGIGGDPGGNITADDYFKTIKLYQRGNTIVGYSQFGRLQFKKSSNTVYTNTKF